jgi:hypothetical protein
MKNFSADQYFETTVSVINPFVRFDPDRTAKEEVKYDVQFFPEGGHLGQRFGKQGWVQGCGQ